MKKHIFSLTATVAILALAGTLPEGRTQENNPAAGKLLQNGSFEDGLNNWKVPTPGVDLKIDPSGASQGEAFIKVTVPPGRTMAVTQEVSGLEAGQKYRAMARVRKVTSEDARFIVRDVQTAKYLVWRTLDAADGWTPIEMTFTAPGDGGLVSIEFNFRVPGACEIDEITLERQ